MTDEMKKFMQTYYDDIDKSALFESVRKEYAMELLEFINDQVAKGNMMGEPGFSAALCLSSLIKKLEEKTKKE